MSFDFLTPHQTHMLVRLLVAGGLFGVFFALLTFFTRRWRQQALHGQARRSRVEILPRYGWRKPKDKKGEKKESKRGK